MDTNLFWCIIGITGGAVASFIISYFFYFRGLTRKRLTYDIKTICIMSDSINQINGLEVKYNSNDIDNLYSSTITLKNIGNSVINKQDIVPLCPISISTSGQFLKPKIKYIESYPTNKISKYNLLFQDNNGTCNSVKFDFDYIPKKAIITYSLFHTGDITFNGDLMDGNITTPIENQRKDKISNSIYFVFLLIVCFILGNIFGYPI